MKLLFVNDKYFENVYKNVSEEIQNISSSLFEFKCIEYEDDKKVIEKFSPDLILYLHNTRSDIHRQQVQKLYNKKYRLACWLLVDNLVETTDVGHFYDFVFTTDRNNLEQRRNFYRYTNVYYLGLEDIYERLMRIKFIYTYTEKDRRIIHKREVYGQNVIYDI